MKSIMKSIEVYKATPWVLYNSPIMSTS